MINFIIIMAIKDAYNQNLHASSITINQNNEMFGNK